jgi:hypothetical protein
MIVSKRKRKRLDSYAPMSMNELKEYMTENVTQKDTPERQNYLNPAIELLYHIYKKTKNQNIDGE